ncbi:MAG TPA: hypothetical protein VIL47_07740 [Candidatus Bipolaricaulota bacterium]
MRILWSAIALEAAALLAATAWAHDAHPGVAQGAAVTLRAVGGQTGPSQEPAIVHVSLFEWGIAPSVLEVPAGAVTFVVQNDGDVAHALHIGGAGVSAQTEVFSSGQTRALQVDLAPGQYTLWCPVPGHRGLGMESPLAASGSTDDASLERALDANANGLMDDAEILNAVRLWIGGQIVPGLGQPLSDAQMLDLIRRWATGEPF